MHLIPLETLFAKSRFAKSCILLLTCCCSSSVCAREAEAVEESISEVLRRLGASAPRLGMLRQLSTCEVSVVASARLL